MAEDTHNNSTSAHPTGDKPSSDTSGAQSTKKTTVEKVKEHASTLVGEATDAALEAAHRGLVDRVCRRLREQRVARADLAERLDGHLAVEDRDDGLHWSVELPESRADVREAVQRGDLQATSWRMVVARDEWRGSVRHVHEIAELRDVSVVTSPAYAEARVKNEGGTQRAADEHVALLTAVNHASDRGEPTLVRTYGELGHEGQADGSSATRHREVGRAAFVEIRSLRLQSSTSRGQRFSGRSGHIQSERYEVWRTAQHGGRNRDEAV